MSRPYRTIAERLTGLNGAALLILRVIAGWLFILHALFKFQMGLAAFEAGVLKPAQLPMTSLLSWSVPTLELVAGVLLIVGLLTRAAAAVLAVEMLFTGFVVKLSAFDSGVLGPKGSGGAEIDFLFFAAFLVIVISGPGWAALDAVFRLERKSVVGSRSDGPALEITPS
ncbi:DoxX family protein [Streptomyces avermitilis]|uniref:DoxX family protein n=1 Tax=Streptomyces avermitilis TaxID=33903 RepID=UPI0033BE52CB